MGFSETYRSEVLQSRRIRARRALFWSRIVGLMLMLAVLATLQMEPQLRRALLAAGVEGMVRVAGGADNAEPQARPLTPQLPASRVKVNRFGDDSAAPAQPADPAAIASEVVRRMGEQNLSP